MCETPTPDLAVPYAAPRLEKTSAEAAPMKPKKGAAGGHPVDAMVPASDGTSNDSGKEEAISEG